MNPRHRTVLAAWASAGVLAAVAVGIAFAVGTGSASAGAPGRSTGPGRASTTTNPPTAPPVRVPSGTVLRQVHCPGGGFTITAPGVGADPASRTVLARFGAVGAVRCVVVDVVGPGQAASTRRVLQVATSGVPGLVRGFERPDVPQTLRPANTACAAYAELPPPVLLVGRDGHFLRPSWPLDYCSHIQQATRRAFAQVTWRTVPTS